MCYPNWVDAPKPESDYYPLTMISPICELTIGDMYKKTPGYLSSVTLTVQDGSTWEIEKNLELPHHIQVAVEFQYIGRYLPSARGKHFELNWLNDKNNKFGTFENRHLEGYIKEKKVERTEDYSWIDHKSLRDRMRDRLGGEGGSRPVEKGSRWNKFIGSDK